MSAHEIDALIRELEESAERLRAGEMDADAAAAVVERCAELAGLIGAELERAAREADREPGGEQEQLL